MRKREGERGFDDEPQKRVPQEAAWRGSLTTHVP
jgi:hypothetical protein